MQRRELLKMALAGTATAVAPGTAGALQANASMESPGPMATWINVHHYGAKGDDDATDSSAINQAIEEAAASGGGTVLFPARVYLCYSIRLKSRVGLYLDHGAVIPAGPTPHDGTSTGGYDAAEPRANGNPTRTSGTTTGTTR